MTVWIVEWQECADHTACEHGIEGVFDSEAKAKQYVADTNIPTLTYTIEPYRVD